MPQAGVIRNLIKSIDLGAAYTLSSPNVLVTAPDGTQTTGVPIVTPAYNVSANPHNFSHIYIPTMGGAHIGKFQFLYNAQTLEYPFQFWVTWTDVYTSIRSLLRQNAFAVPDSLIDFEFLSLFIELDCLSGWALPNYQDFTDTYKLYFDQGMVYLIASRLRPTVAKVASGELTMFKKGTTTAQWTSGQVQRSSSIEEDWWTRGMALFQAGIPELYNAIYLDIDASVVMSRGSLAEGNPHPLSGWVIGTGGGTGSLLTLGASGEF